MGKPIYLQTNCLKQIVCVAYGITEQQQQEQQELTELIINSPQK
jgi:hypothetical protein